MRYREPVPDGGMASRCGALAMDRGEQRGVGADQGRMLLSEQQAVQAAALGDPLIGQVHRAGPVHHRHDQRNCRVPPLHPEPVSNQVSNNRH